jgi:PAS domain S-box-containing protein
MAKDPKKKIATKRNLGRINYCEKRFCDILSQASDALFVCDASGTLLLANSAFEKLLETRNPLGIPLEQLRPVEIAALVAEQNASVLATGKTRSFELAIENEAGNLRTFQITKGVKREGPGGVSGIFARVREISERLAAEQEIIDTSDYEKQRLGREIRENLCQHLVGISLLGNALYEELARLGIEQAEDARQIAQFVKEVVTEVRNVEKGLSVTHLEQGGGLVEALEDLAEQVRAVGGIDCSFQKPTLVPVLEPKTAMYLFRIAQEAVDAFVQNNGSHLEIRLLNQRDSIVLSVKNYGMADGLPITFGRNGASSMMGHRSRAIGAKLEIKQPRNGGVDVICTLRKRKRHKPQAGAQKGSAK